MSHTTKSRSVRKNAGTQTSEMETILEIARLQEQVKLLTIENEHLRKYTIEKPSNILTRKAPSVSPNSLPKTPKHPELTKEKKLENQSTRKKNKAATRGCNCKGNCSSKMCGCVKKDVQCGEWCRCTNSVCQNQEQADVEQDKENVEENIREDKEIMNKHVANVTTHRSIFSPDIVVHNANTDIEEFRPGSLSFDIPKKLAFGSDEEEETNEKVKKIKEKSKNVQKETARRRGRSKRNNLEVTDTEPTRRQRSVSNQEKKRASNMELEKHALRKCSSSEISMEMGEEIMKIDKRTNNYLQNVLHGMVSLRRDHKKTEHQVKETKNVTDSKTKVISTTFKEDNLQATSQDVKNKSPNSSHSSQTDFDTKNLENSGLNDTYVDDFDPMKPKREIARTPTHGSKESSYSTPDLFPAPIIIPQNVEEEFPVPEELTQPEVDWEEYQSQLVACDKCKRKFHPFRIKKHQSCCKKI